MTGKKAPSKVGRLSNRQRLFVKEYLVDLNATQAAIRAGYSVKTAGQIGDQNLRKLQIAAAIEEEMRNRASRIEITQDMVLRELAKIGFSDIRKIVRWGNTELRQGVDADGESVTEPYHGLMLVGADDLDDDTAAAIAEISESAQGLKVKLHDKKGALVDIGRHLGMFPSRTEITGRNGGPIETSVVRDMSDAELDAELARYGLKS